LLFGIIFFVERPMRLKAQRERSSSLLPGLRPENVQALQVGMAGQQELRFERTKTNWMLTSPITYPARTNKINQLLETLSLVQWQGRITPEELKNRPESTEEFGFSRPQFSLILSEGKYKRHLDFGTNTYFGDQVFAKLVGGEGIYILDSQILKVLPKNPDDWRDTTLLPPELISRGNLIRVRAGTRGLDLSYDSTNELWRLSWPFPARADQEKTESLRKSLALTQIEQFVMDDPAADLQPFGLQPPELEISFLQGTNPLAKLDIGRSSTNSPQLVYARVVNRPSVYLIPREQTEQWKGPPNEFRDRHLLNIAPSEMDRIDFKGEQTFSAIRNTNGVWKLNPQGWIGDPEAMTDLTLHLANIEVEFERTVVTDFSAYGLSNALMEVTVHKFSAPTSSVSFQIGTNVGKIFVRRTDDEFINVIKSDDLDQIPFSPQHVRHRAVWNFQSSDVIAIRIFQQGAKRELKRNEKFEWSFAANSQGVINTFALEEALHRVGGLRAVIWHDFNAQDLDKVGIKEVDYAIEFEINRAGAREVLRVDFGGFSRINPLAVVTVNGEKRLFEFPIDLFRNILLKDLTIEPGRDLRLPKIAW